MEDILSVSGYLKHEIVYHSLDQPSLFLLPHPLSLLLPEALLQPPGQLASLVSIDLAPTQATCQ